MSEEPYYRNKRRHEREGTMPLTGAPFLGTVDPLDCLVLTPEQEAKARTLPTVQLNGVSAAAIFAELDAWRRTATAANQRAHDLHTENFRLKNELQQARSAGAGSPRDEAGAEAELLREVGRTAVAYREFELAEFDPHVDHAKTGATLMSIRNQAMTNALLFRAAASRASAPPPKEERNG